MMEHEEYIGDGVYAELDGFGVWLTTNNGIGVTNKIYLETAVWRALMEFMRRGGQVPDKRNDEA